MSGSPRTVMLPQQYHHSHYNGPPYPPYASRLPYPQKTSIVHHGQPPPQPHDKSNSVPDHRVSKVRSLNFLPFHFILNLHSFESSVSMKSDYDVVCTNPLFLHRVTCTSTQHPRCQWNTRGTTLLLGGSTPLTR